MLLRVLAHSFLAYNELWWEGFKLNKGLLWTGICTLCILILLSTGTLFDYTGNKIKLDIPIRISPESEYAVWEENYLDANPDYENLAIYIDINTKTLELIDKDNKEILKKYTVATGTAKTPSPIGSWTIIRKSKWGRGFGTRWMALNVPWGKYGIHGTNRPSSIGSAASHGCIRMKNKDVEELYDYVKIGTPVVISGGVFGPFGNGFRVIRPGHTGSDVYEVQRIMKQKGYYPGYMDGIYGESMKAGVIKFRKDNNLTLTHDIDWEFYRAMEIQLFE